MIAVSAGRQCLPVKVVGHDSPVTNQSTGEVCNLVGCKDRERVEDQVDVTEHGPRHPYAVTLLPPSIRPGAYCAPECPPRTGRAVHEASLGNGGPLTHGERQRRGRPG